MRPQSEESAKAVTPFWWASLMAWDRWRVGDVGFPRKNQTGCQPMPKPIYIYIYAYMTSMKILHSFVSVHCTPRETNLIVLTITSRCQVVPTILISSSFSHLSQVINDLSQSGIKKLPALRQKGTDLASGGTMLPASARDGGCRCHISRCFWADAGNHFYVHTNALVGWSSGNTI